MEEEDLGGVIVKTMSIALAGTLCNPLEQSKGSQSKWQDA